jgi:hypothetical protein
MSLEMLKSVVTTVILALALGQALGMAAGLLILGTLVASALWYFCHCCGTGFRWLNRVL